MSSTVAVKKTALMDAMEQHHKDVRQMVMESYGDMQKGQGREYRDFFSELESRYKDAEV